MESVAFDLAAHECGHTIVGACEIDKYARSVYIRHFPGVHVHTDATKIEPTELPGIDLLCAGFPCQAFSIAGHQRGFEDARGTLFFEIIKIAKEKRCTLLLENVKGLLGHDKGLTWLTMLSCLAELRYNVQWQCINSKHYIPQNRERLYIVATPREKPTPQIFPFTPRNYVNTETRSPPAGNGKHVYYKYSRCITATYHKGWGGGRTLICVHKDKSQARRIYDANGIASNLIANGGGLGAKTGLYSVPNGIRKLTPLECERLQTFPDRWTALGHDDTEMSDTQRYRMVGNAVTVKVVADIMKRLGGE